MNILFFLTTAEVIYVNEEDCTVGQAMDTMKKYKYSAVPIITKAGRYAGTLTEGDLLWGLKNKTDLVQKGLEKVRITEIPRRSDNQPLLVNADMEDLLGKIMNQNFVPVLDDQKNFIGIITQKKMLSVTFVKIVHNDRSVHQRDRIYIFPAQDKRIAFVGEEYEWLSG